MDNFDMEIDFLTSEDAVQRFLISKLKLVESKKLELTKQLERRQSILTETLRKSATSSPKQLVTIEKIWKKMVNRLYVIGINISTTGNIDEVDVTLSWKEKLPLNYSYDTSQRFYKTFFSAPPSKIQTIIATISMPAFTHTATYYVDGLLENNKDTANQVVIPTIALEASDVTNDKFLVRKRDLLLGDKESLLALMEASEETKLFLYLQHTSYKSVETMLEMNCYFRLIPTKSGCLFYAGEASDYFDGVVLQSFEGAPDFTYLNIYSKNVDQMLAIVHHLYKHISDAVILPVSLKEQFRSHLSLFSENEVKTKMEDLKKCLQNEINLVDEFFERYRIHCDNSDDMHTTDIKILESYRKFRHELNEQEMESDVLYCAIKNCAVDYEDSKVDDASDASL